MGYRSEVGVLITVPAKVNSDKLVKKLRRVYGECFDDDFDSVEVYNRYDNRLIYLHADWIKWYESYDDIHAFMEFLGMWPYKTGGVHFLRIGESADDVEESYYGDPQEFIDLHRSMSICV